MFYLIQIPNVLPKNTFLRINQLFLKLKSNKNLFYINYCMTNLTREHVEIARNFFKKHMGNQPIGGGMHGGSVNQNYLGFPSSDATRIAQGLWFPLLREHPKINQIDFDKLMTERLHKCFKLVNSATKYMYGISKYVETIGSPAGFIASFLESTASINLNFEDTLQSAKLFSRTALKWVTQKPVTRGEFTIKYSIFPHTECPLAIEVLNKEGKRIATIGGILHYRKGSLEIRLTNSQGVRTKKGEISEKEKKKAVRKNAAQYERLSKELGENWRTHFVKQVLTIAKVKQAKLIGELPRRFSIMGIHKVPRSEYRRQTKRVREAYEQAGLKRSIKRTYRSTHQTKKR